MRTFSLGSGDSRKFVQVIVDGPRMTVVQGKADGTTRKSEKTLGSPAEAASAGDLMARELISRGFIEQTDGRPSRSKAPRPPASASAPKAPSKPKPAAAEADDTGAAYLLEAEEEAEPAAPLLPRLAPAPGAATAADDKPAKAKKKKKKGKKSGTGGGDELDRRVLAGIGAGVLAIVGLLGYVTYEAFLKPASLVGTWQGSRLDYEAGGPMSHVQMRLVLDAQGRFSQSFGDSDPDTGTYTRDKSGRLVLISVDPDDGSKHETAYKIDLAKVTLDLYDPDSGKKQIQLIRQTAEKPSVAGGAPAPAAPKAVAAGGPADEAADAKLASVEFSPKDNAFKLRHPPGWEAASGAHPDNTYSWARFEKGSAKIHVEADIKGSLMSGADAALTQQFEEGDESAPVHRAHELYKDTAKEKLGDDFRESAPVAFKGSGLGEGRISEFTVSGGGLFGGKVRGYHVTFLTQNRRVSLLCECPEGDFAKLGPTFLAVCRSVSR
jgi:hypothetical protein